jgi:hypothetical protein
VSAPYSSFSKTILSFFWQKISIFFIQVISTFIEFQLRSSYFYQYQTFGQKCQTWPDYLNTKLKVLFPKTFNGCNTLKQVYKLSNCKEYLWSLFQFK